MKQRKKLNVSIIKNICYEKFELISDGWLDSISPLGRASPGYSGPLRVTPTLSCNILYKTHLETGSTSLDLQSHREYAN